MTAARVIEPTVHGEQAAQIGSERTREVFRNWLKERTGREVGQPTDWTAVTSREILELSERQLDAAKVPANARLEYYRQFTNYIYRLK